MTLEDSIGAFERGVALVRSLNHKLDEIERKVEVLTRNAQGDLKTAPMADLEDENAPAPRTSRDKKNQGGQGGDDEPPF